MRALITVGFALLLGACDNDQAANITAEDGNVVAESLRGNDITAIDAATNDSANMAADVEFTLNETNLADNAANEAATNETVTNEAR